MLELVRNIRFIVSVVVFGLMITACNDESPPTAATTEPDVTDLSENATLTVSDENPGGPFAGEGSSKSIDGDKYTKFLIFDYDPDFWMQQDFEESVTINAYTITSGNDAPDRDPHDWTLAGSNDGGSTWETIHTVTSASFTGRNKVNIYGLDSEATYSSFRLSITDNAGETSLMQLSEWRLLYYNGEVPEL
ncbi:F5/8 type C domain-containing protein [Fodinibius roseus]|uniref:F5/8 type C domain-containing protein n=1 Tax=Fodinibius roseus TaxID=1194090 RepID=A0A1M5FXW8_9BACT|nr:discoidin domain-containing protein [Fodinibius roseus]SHF96234.1 F5/8 type C domain-containing protein [Fodinibius roseus]